MNTEKKTYAYRETELVSGRVINSRRYLKRERNHARRRNDIAAIIADFHAEDSSNADIATINQLLHSRDNDAIEANIAEQATHADVIFVPSFDVMNMSVTYTIQHATNVAVETIVLDTVWSRCKHAINCAISKWVERLDYLLHETACNLRHLWMEFYDYLIERISIHFPDSMSEAREYLAKASTWNGAA